jgi:hypothetical protein
MVPPTSNKMACVESSSGHSLVHVAVIFVLCRDLCAVPVRRLLDSEVEHYHSSRFKSGGCHVEVYCYF